MPQNVGSKEGQISKNITSRHTQNSAMLIILRCTQCVPCTIMLIVVRLVPENDQHRRIYHFIHFN